MNYKICKTCNIEKPVKDYYKQQGGMLGVKAHCKECYTRIRVRNKSEATRERNRIRQRQYYRDNTELLVAKQKEYYENNKDKVKEYRKRPLVRYKKYIRGAEERGLDFSLTEQEFLSFWQKECYYCGAIPETIGIDRMRNEEGYSLDNVVACCKDCNFLKHNLTPEVFLDRIKKIYDYQNRS